MFGGKIFDLFAIGGCLSLDFMSNLRFKNFLISFRYAIVKCFLLKHALEIRTSNNLHNQK
ncbi:hypothetical protein [Helicobacter pylori]|uniref:hypothetical protein n=1 Tax=Helicobacter pylori TaxID=210 RepID=UPI00026B4A28|nr:hypothetical protein [Helicobacter pylori]EJC23725.1 aspartyl/glutamyl-tRNA amidotransferase subunit B [Helicobacter pylori Hp P-4d]EJC24821.1 aspartyl/glutamyl-tRNA amidotransferase subunit B [Helicobacter pylori Hp P-4c]EMH18304.1 hypothetical protein HMPREF1417_01376 [Helicobacter pylori GAM260Bi]EMH70231.1 hypothetical protein HMPREF1452_01466 [Helicobacter pylori HP260Bi]PUD42480.1 hypothetical protein C2R75_01440 [Helicobacter pylori]